MSLSRDQVRQVTHLARLRLNDDELAELTPQLNAIIDYVNQLQEVDTTNIEPLAHPLAVTNVFREDELQSPLPVDESLRNAPARQDDYFSVPAVLD